MIITPAAKGRKYCLVTSNRNAYMKIPDAYVDAPAFKELEWEREIRELMEDFLMPQEKMEQITNEVKAISKENDKNSLKYDRAWNKFKAWLNAA